jgi:hypothetical protein
LRLGRHSGSNFQTLAIPPMDDTQWRNYAVKWTPSGTGYTDGVQPFNDADPAQDPRSGCTKQSSWNSPWKDRRSAK